MHRFGIIFGAGRAYPIPRPIERVMRFGLWVFFGLAALFVGLASLMILGALTGIGG